MIKSAGRMGWKESDFWISTPSYFFCAIEGWMDQERDRAETGFAQARLIAYFAGFENLRTGTTMQDIWPLSFDNREPKYPEVTEEELRIFNEKADRAFKMLNGVGSTT